MKPVITLILLLVTLATMNGKGVSRLVKSPSGRATLMVNGSPFVIIGGETGNSMASCREDVDEVMSKAVAHGYNTVLIPMAWELIEPRKDEFDFSSVDDILNSARSRGLKVVPLWFGAWKNSMSCYAPAWFKRDTRSYPRAMTSNGNPLEIASAFSDDVYEADATAFRKLLRHISETDTDGTVIMIQLENEIGMIRDARDHSPLAEAEYRKGVPADLMKHIERNKARLHPWLMEKWKSNGMKRSGSWTDVFGDDIYTDEIFQAWAYGKYVERLAREARKVFPEMPLYVNAAMNSRGRKPGQYPSAGPLAHLKDVWHASAPTVDILAPDLYDKGFLNWVDAYALSDNPLFIPEIKSSRGNVAQAFYTIGEKGAIGLSPFSYNSRSDADVGYQREGNGVLASLIPIIKQDEDPGRVNGLYFDSDSTTRTIVRDGLSITASHYFTLPWDPRAKDGSEWPAAGGVIIRIAPMEYLIAGSGVVLSFAPADAEVPADAPKLGEDGFALNGSEPQAVQAEKAVNGDAKSGTPSCIGLATVEEVEVMPDGSLKRVRTLNGDETHQGRHVRIGVDGFKILRVTLYEY